MRRYGSRWASILMMLALSAWQGGCAPKESDPRDTTTAPVEVAPPTARVPATQSPAATADAQDVQQARQRLEALGTAARYTAEGPRLTEIIVVDGADLTADDFALFGKLADLRKLQIFNCRILNDELARHLAGLSQLRSLALTNSVINDPTVEMIATSFPQLTELDLSSNTNLTQSAMKSIAELRGLRSLTLIQTRFNDVSTRRLKELQALRSLDLRGNMEAGNMTLAVVGELPALVAFKHRSTAVTDEGLEQLSRAPSLENLLLQDFMISDASGEYLARLSKLKQLEIFRCQGFGSDGVTALQGLPLERLTLRDLPSVDDRAMVIFADMPKLKRLYLHELEGLSDDGLQHLGQLQSLELLDVWSVPQLSDQTVKVLAQLPLLKELSLRTTDVTDACVELLLAMPQLQSLTLKENSQVSWEAAQRLQSRQWNRLDIGQP